MSFDILRESVQRNGFFQINNVVPETLRLELLTMTAGCHGFAKSEWGPDAQRLQPLGKYLDDRQLTPLRHLCESNYLQDTIAAVLGQRTYGNPMTMGVLLNPQDNSWGMRWHRDWLHKDFLAIEPYMLEVDHAIRGRPSRELVFPSDHFLCEWLALGNVLPDQQACFWQFNLALRDDDALLIAPGSQNYVNLTEEKHLRKLRPLYLRGDQWPEDLQEQLQAVELTTTETFRLRRIHLPAGSLIAYPAFMAHAAIYRHDVLRHTLHDFFMTPYFEWWRLRMIDLIGQRQEHGAQPWFEREDGELARLSIRLRAN